MSLQNDLELIYLRESYMKNPNMLSCVDTHSSTLSEELHEDDHPAIQSALKQWFDGKSSAASSNKNNGNTRSIRNQSCLQLSKPNDKLNRLVSFYL